ncbi:hypothetical protein GCM10011608_21420 [Micromonospora sonchi]|uniref:Aromatic ring-opening dioxygenase LigA n=1 Tax=Micromonospora sonchi TaxID=1763543 RepID=A0A917TSS2_9ACTN|nr:aromatic ring-opening dioxygenase LigA [Micromonospora sonchi]GGM36480.1 hypothetical protein GCM10011608_21420 [Micromonospora sonchi]
MTDTSAPAVATPKPVGATVRLLSILVIIAGLIMLAAGATTWFVVQSQLADERITVSDDADRFAGKPIKGPFTAYAEAEVIEKHSLEASGGKTYAELDREDPTRQVVMTGSFLRSSLFTSVVSFGVAALAMGLGVVVALVGYALLTVSRQLNAITPANSSTS